MSGSVSFYRKELANALENQSIEEISAKRAREILKEHLRKLGQDGDWDVEKDKKVINQLLMEMVQSKNDSVSKKKKKRRRADQESDESDKGDQDGNMVGIRKRQEKKDSEKKHVKKRKSSVPLLKKLRKLCQLKQIK